MGDLILFRPRQAQVAPQEDLQAVKRAQNLAAEEARQASRQEFKGSKYDSSMDIAEVAKRVRADIKEAIKQGPLPKGKYSVRTERYSMGQSLDVVIKDVPVQVINPERVADELANPHQNSRHSIYTPEGSALKKLVEAIVSAYNRDNSDTMTDYFDVKFYGGVDFDWEWRDEQRRQIADKLQNFSQPV